MAGGSVNFRNAIAQCILNEMERNPKVLLLGEGVSDPIGIFGTCLPAHARFPSRVIETPLSETMLTGACVGLALEGWKPIFVHARFDFALFTFEHLINTASKIPFIQKGQRVPIVIRVLVGRGWGQGPTHGQNFAAALANVPGIRVFIPTTNASYGWALWDALMGDGPAIIVEHRRFYDMERPELPSGGLRNRLFDVQIAAIGDAIIEAEEAGNTLRNMGVYCHVAAIERLFEPTPEFIKGVPAVIVENGHARFGVGAGLATQMAPIVRAPIAVIASPFSPLPASMPLEAEWYVTTERIVQAACGLLGTVPDGSAMAAISSGEGRDGRKEAF